MVYRRYWEVLRLKKTMRSLGPHWLEQGLVSWKTSFPWTGVGEWFRFHLLLTSCFAVQFLTDHGPLPVCSPGLVTPRLEEKQQSPLELTLHPTESWGRLENHYVDEATCSKQWYKKGLWNEAAQVLKASQFYLHLLEKIFSGPQDWTIWPSLVLRQ